MIAVYRAEDGTEVRKHGHTWAELGDEMQTAEDVHRGIRRVFRCVELVPEERIEDAYDPRANVGIIVRDGEHVSRQLPRWHPAAPRHTKEGRPAFENMREVREFQAATNYGWDKQ